MLNTLAERCAKLQVEDSVKKDLLQKIRALALEKNEERILTAVFPPEDAAFAEYLKLYQDAIQVIRRSINDNLFFQSGTQIQNWIPTKEDMEKEQTLRLLMSSWLAWHDSESSEMGIRVINKLDEFSGGNFLFTQLDSPWNERYIGLSSVFFERYFVDLSVDHQNVILGTRLLLIFVWLGLDLDAILEQMVGSYAMVENRRRACFDCVAVFNSNRAPFGTAPDGKAMLVTDWIELFRNRSVKKFTEQSLNELLTDPQITAANDPETLRVIKIVLQAYRNVLLEDYATRDIKDQLKNLPALPQTANALVSEKPSNNTRQQEVKEVSQTLKKIIDGEFEKDTDDNYKDIAGVFQRIYDIAEERRNPYILQAFYFDEKQGKFVWNI